MTPKTQSVCKHCHGSIFYDESNPNMDYWRHVESASVHCPETEAEPLSEPASTGEPPYCDLCGHAITDAKYHGIGKCVSHAARPSEPTAPQMSAEPSIRRDHAEVPLSRRNFKSVAAAPQPVSGDAPLTTDEKLVLLMEECAEVIKAASKCLRFGYTRNHPAYGDNDKVLSTEVGDLLGVVEALPLDGELIQEARKTRIARAEKAKVLYGR